MFLGIEIGGTKLQLGVGAGDGVLAGLWRGGVDVAAGPEGIRRQIAADFAFHAAVRGPMLCPLGAGNVRSTLPASCTGCWPASWHRS
jgi:hypothetical protein